MATAARLAASPPLCPSPLHLPSHHCLDRLGSALAHAYLSPPVPLSPLACRGSPGQRTSPGLYPPPIRILLARTPVLALWLDAHSVPVETRNWLMRKVVKR